MPDESIQQSGIFHPRETDVMNAATAAAHTDEERAASFVAIIEKLVGRERAPKAIGIAPGTIENIRRLRRKTMPSTLYRKIRGGVVRVCTEKIRHLESAISLALEGDEGGDDRELLAAAYALAELQEVIRRVAR